MAQVIHDVKRAIAALEKLLPRESDADDCYSSDIQVAINILKCELQRRETVLSDREAAAAAIDIETCEITSMKADDLDPYGIGCESYQVGTNIFVRPANDHGWVWEGDLPEATAHALYARIERERESGI